VAQANEFPQHAFDTLVARVHAPVFFDKLARDYGHVPSSDDERRALLELASSIQAKKADDQVKAAARGTGLVFEALDGVKQALVRDGILPAHTTTSERQIKEAAAYVTQDPALVEAAAAYAAFLAAQAG
jgi:hypothetical protein